MPVTFPLDDLLIALGAGTYQPISDPGTARFRCLNVPPPLVSGSAVHQPASVSSSAVMSIANIAASRSSPIVMRPHSTDS